MKGEEWGNETAGRARVGLACGYRFHILSQIIFVTAQNSINFVY